MVKYLCRGESAITRLYPLRWLNLFRRRLSSHPTPGLIGAFGAALEVQDRIENGLLQESFFDIDSLIDKDVGYGKSFTCPGTTENCDRGCSISIITLDGKKYPFGGSCNKYYNQLHHLDIDPVPLDYVDRRQKLLYQKYTEVASEKTVGFSRALYMQVLFPLYYHFFTGLGFKVVLSDESDPEGVQKTASSFCYPVEIAHGMYQNLLKKKPDYIFLPHVSRLYSPNRDTNRDKGNNCTCVLAQCEPYYLKSAFKDSFPKPISPVLDFHKGYLSMKEEFIKIGRRLGCNKKTTEEAYVDGMAKQNAFYEKKKKLGLDAIRLLEKNPSDIGVVIFGRPYNSLSEDANMGIPRKFASRGVTVIPFDCLPCENENSMENMNWAVGHEIIQASRYVKKHPQLFGAYITNFSCGPDSFVLGYFRDIMQTKPSLTLELDSHSADAGINTRVEAFLDIVDRFRKLALEESRPKHFRPAYITKEKGQLFYVTSDNRYVPLKSPNVHLIIPSMGRAVCEFGAAAFRGMGFNATAVPHPTFETLMLGRCHSSCKECLPLIMTTSALIDHTQKRDKDELTLYFMPSTGGNCRFAQYHVYIKGLIKKLQIPNVALLTLSAEQNYVGLGGAEQIHILQSLILSDIMDDIGNAIMVLPKDKKHAREVFNTQWKRIVASLERGSEGSVRNTGGCCQASGRNRETVAIKPGKDGASIGGDIRPQG